MSNSLQRPMKKCPYCAEIILEDATVCRYCGRDLSTGQVPVGFRPYVPPPAPTAQKKRGCGRTALIIGLVLLGVIALGTLCTTLTPSSSYNSSVSRSVVEPSVPPTPTLTSDQLSQLAKKVKFDDLARKTENYVGELVHFRGQVVQVSEKAGTSVDLRVNVTKSKYGWDDTVWLNYTGPRLLEDDVVDFYAKVDGRKTYTAVMGNEITLPELTAVSLSVVD